MAISKKDDNHNELRDYCRSIPLTRTEDTHEMRRGRPDIIIGTSGLSLVCSPAVADKIAELLARIAPDEQYEVHDGCNLWIEVKDGSKYESQQKLTDDEEDWFDTWPGHKAIWKCVEDAARALGFW